MANNRFNYSQISLRVVICYGTINSFLTKVCSNRCAQMSSQIFSGHGFRIHFDNTEDTLKIFRTLSLSLRKYFHLQKTRSITTLSINLLLSSIIFSPQKLIKFTLITPPALYDSLPVLVSIALGFTASTLLPSPTTVRDSMALVCKQFECVWCGSA